MHININLYSKTSVLVRSAMFCALGLGLVISYDTPWVVFLGGGCIGYGLISLARWIDTWCYYELRVLRAGRPPAPHAEMTSLRDAVSQIEAFVEQFEAHRERVVAWQNSDEGVTAMRPFGAIRPYLKARKEHMTCA